MANFIFIIKKKVFAIFLEHHKAIYILVVYKMHYKASLKVKATKNLIESQNSQGIEKIQFKNYK